MLYFSVTKLDFVLEKYLGKQCGPRSDCSGSVLSGTTLFAIPVCIIIGNKFYFMYRVRNKMCDFSFDI